MSVAVAVSDPPPPVDGADSAGSDGGLQRQLGHSRYDLPQREPIRLPTRSNQSLALDIAEIGATTTLLVTHPCALAAAAAGGGGGGVCVSGVLLLLLS